MHGQHLRTIARIHSDFPQKFGIPRQSGVVASLRATVVFEPMYRQPQAVKGLNEFSHIWLIWGFSAVQREAWSPTVRPPLLGGNERMGVFATRSPFRPNAIGLSSVVLEGIEWRPSLGAVLHVSGADLMDGSPIYDIKPYLPFTDAHPEATGGFSQRAAREPLQVQIPLHCMDKIPADKHISLVEVLSQDPRPSYQEDPGRRYGMAFAGLNVTFVVKGDRLEVLDVEPGGEWRGEG